jgi:hypothetical protein
MKKLFLTQKSLMLLAITIVCLSPSFSQATYLLDTFSDDTIGSPPNGPEIGSATYGGSGGTHTVFSQAGDRRLRSSDTSASGSILITYIPIAYADLMQVQYLFRVESGAVLVGQNAFTQQLVLRPIGTNLMLDWGNDKKFYIRITRPGEPTTDISTGISWLLNTDYQVNWTVNLLTDRFTLSVNNTTLVLNGAVGVDITGMSSLSLSTNYNTTGNQVIDNVTIARICDGPCLWYVDSIGPGRRNGTSWADAFRYLQDALAAASSGEEIRVAQGIYKPDRGGNNTPGDRNASFQLKNGVAIYGGYAGSDEPDPDARDLQAYQTILSGDLTGNDGPNFANNGENSYHVVTGSGTDETAILDGVTITGGNATDPYPANAGGGIYMGIGRPTLTNCTFIRNKAQRGGAVSNPSYASRNPSFIRCKFLGNSAGVGGGIESQGGAPALTNCIFSGNIATNDGAAVFNMGYSNLTLTNCSLSANSAEGSGGGIWNSWNTATVRVLNCILWANSDSGGMDQSAQIHIASGAADVDYSCIEGLTGSLGGAGNIGDDPRFVDPDGPDNIVGSEDDNLRLLVGSPCIDTGHPGPQYQDLDGTRNDMGAYGGTWGDVSAAGTHSASGFIFTSVGNIPFSEIVQNDPINPERVGLADVNATNANLLGIPPYTDSPFGGTLWLHGLFGYNDNVDYYKILVARWNDGNEPNEDDYVALSDSLTKVRYFIDPCDGTWRYEYVNLGPKTIDGITNLYELTDEGYWSHIDLRARWNTTVYENGRYTLTCKAFRDVGGTLVDITPRLTVIDLILVVDNSPVTAEIHNVKYDPGSPNYNPITDGEIPECAIIGLTGANENLRFTITASHPNGYLRTYVLDVISGKNNYRGVIASDSYNPDTKPLLWYGVTEQEFQSADGSQDPWENCAYQFRLEAWSRATDGFYWIYWAGFSNHYYLDLGTASCGSADLDRNGRVDFRDLARLAEHWLETCGP